MSPDMKYATLLLLLLLVTITLEQLAPKCKLFIPTTTFLSKMQTFLSQSLPLYSYCKTKERGYEREHKRNSPINTLLRYADVGLVKPSSYSCAWHLAALCSVFYCFIPLTLSLSLSLCHISLVYHTCLYL